MKIAVASEGQWLASTVDWHTGRAACFIVYDTLEESFVVVDNWHCTECIHWAGLQSANAIVETGAEAIIVRNIGPNTFRTLTNANISVYCTPHALQVATAIRLLREKKLPKARCHNCPGHHHIK